MTGIIDSPYLIPSNQQVDIHDLPTSSDTGLSRDELKDQLSDTVEQIAEHQRVLYADNRYSLLLIFQALDAAGKDSTIRAVLKGVNPAGCQVFSFKQPSKEELDHDFLWRTAVRLPERGRIGVFNRSYYEETLVVRVHPEYLRYQNLPDPDNSAQLWQSRFESINSHEKHLAANGTVIMKFWLNVSRQEQHQRFRSRLEDPKKRWKFAKGDLQESELWDDYMHAYQEVLNHTSTPWAPWYAIPADSKTYMRTAVAKLIEQRLASLPISYPEPGALDEETIETYLSQLIDE